METIYNISQGMIINQWRVSGNQEIIRKNHHYLECTCTICGNMQLLDTAVLKKNGNPKCKLCSAQTEYTLYGWQLDEDYNKIAGLVTHGRKKAVIPYDKIYTYLIQGGRINNAILIDNTVKIKSERIKNDYTNQHVGKLTVLEYMGQGTKQSQNAWLCRCDCGNLVLVGEVTLSRNNNPSCSKCRNAHLKKDRIPTKDWTPIKFHHTASEEEHNASYWEYRCNYCGAIKILNATKVDSLTQIPRCECQYKHSRLEDEIYQFIRDIYDKTIIRNDRTVIKPDELDIYLPDLKIAIECNGNYWHSYVQRPDANYHYAKTQRCSKLGIRLIHIFEYEWLTNKKGIQAFLESQLQYNITKYYARNCNVQRITVESANEFCKAYHLQGAAQCTEAWGLFYNNELLMVATYGQPRFSQQYDTELIRLCTKHKTAVIGGAGKLFRAYILKHPNDSIVSYCNIAKFTGTTYEKLGFTYEYVTKPNYVYVKHLRVLTRYQCQKHKLVEQGYDANLSETEIMFSRGYDKIYDCGNAVYSYIKQ